MERQFTASEEQLLKEILEEKKMALLKQYNNIEKKIIDRTKPINKYKDLLITVYTKILLIVSMEKELEKEGK